MSGPKIEYVTGTALVPVQTDVPLSIEAAIERHNLIVEFVKKVLVKGIDYGTVPGIDEDFLLNPGAEKLSAFFGLRMGEPEIVSEKEDWDKPLFAYTYRVKLYRLGEMIAWCDGHCNSMESKYRYRNVWDWKATDADKTRAIRVEKRNDKNGQQHTVYVVENDDIYSQVNTLRKMAQKRARVGAVHIACSVSEFFSHGITEIVDPEELEDLGNGSGNGQPEPTGAAVIRDRLQKSAAGFKADSQATDGQRGLLVGKLSEALLNKDDKLRHLILKYLWGVESSKALSYGQVGAMLKWLVAGKDGQTGDYLLNKEAIQELQVISKEAQIDAGQLIMELCGDEVTV